MIIGKKYKKHLEKSRKGMQRFRIRQKEKERTLKLKLFKKIKEQAVNNALNNLNMHNFLKLHLFLVNRLHKYDKNHKMI